MEATPFFTPIHTANVLGLLTQPELACCERCGTRFMRESRFIRICDGCRSDQRPVQARLRLVA